MQLEHKQKFIRGALAVATASMLGQMPKEVQAQPDENGWELDSALLYYSEKDRVMVYEPVVRASKSLGDGEYLNTRVVVDSLTGSSANGAIPTSSAQTFTSPSGDSSYTTPANETPLDPTFHDTRVAVNFEWEKPLSKQLKGLFSVNASNEFDYQSLGVATTFAWDTNNRNTTYTAGASYNSDSVNPVGNVPTGLTAVPTTIGVQKTSTGSTESKTVSELLLGVTQVLSRKTLLQFNYTYGMDDGYLTDPYKLLSVLDNSGNLRGTDPYLYEKRPDSRTRQAMYLKLVHHFSEDVLHVSYRYYWDDWGINAHTVDMRYRTELGNGHYLQPHLRYSDQGKADFYNYSLSDGSIPQYASADYRLDDMTTTTFGIKYGIELGKNSEFGTRVESISQSSTHTELDALLFQINYSFKF